MQELDKRLEIIPEIMSLDEFLEFVDVLSLERRKFIYQALLNQYLLIYNAQLFHFTEKEEKT